MISDRLLPSALGVDIGDEVVKLAVLRHGWVRAVEVVALTSQKVEESTIRHGVIQDPERFKYAIQRSLQKFGLDTDQLIASVALPEERVYVTSLQLNHRAANSDPAKLAEQHFPIRGREAEVRSTVLVSNDGAKRMILMSMDRQTLHQTTQAFQQAALRLGAIEFDALALIRLLKFDGTWPEFLLVADIGNRHSTLAAMHPEQGVFTELNLTSISGRQMTESVQSALRLSAAQAESLKQLYGLRMTAEQQTAVYQAVRPVVSVFAEEVQQFIKFLIRHHGLTIPKDCPLILVGGGSRTLGLAELLSSDLNRPVQSWAPGARYRLLAKLPRDAYPIYAVAIGTALRLI